MLQHVGGVPLRMPPVQELREHPALGMSAALLGHGLCLPQPIVVKVAIMCRIAPVVPESAPSVTNGAPMQCSKGQMGAAWGSMGCFAVHPSLHPMASAGSC